MPPETLVAVTRLDVVDQVTKAQLTLLPVSSSAFLRINLLQLKVVFLSLFQCKIKLIHKTVSQFLKLMCWMGKHKDLSNFDQGQIVMARRQRSEHL